MSEDVVLRAVDLVKTYGSGYTAVHAVAGVSAEIRRGEVVLVMGPSGSGKTTLLSMLGGLLRPASGTVEVQGAVLTELSERHLSAVRARSLGWETRGSAPARCWNASVWATVSTRSRDRCPAARSSGSPSPAPSSTSHRSSWPTSPLGTSTPSAARR